MPTFADCGLPLTPRVWTVADIKSNFSTCLAKRCAGGPWGILKLPSGSVPPSLHSQRSLFDCEQQFRNVSTISTRTDWNLPSLIRPSHRAPPYLPLSSDLHG